MAIYEQNKQPLRTDVYGGKSRDRPLSVLRIHASLSLCFNVTARLLTNDSKPTDSCYTVHCTIKQEGRTPCTVYRVFALLPDFIIGVAQKET